MDVNVEVFTHDQDEAKYRATYSLPGVPGKGDRVAIGDWGLLEVGEVWWVDGEPPLLTLLGGVPGAHVLGHE